MPIYCYRCPICKKEIEEIHSIKEIDNPSIELQKRVSCNENTCTEASFSTGELVVPEYGKEWIRIPQLTAIDSFSLMDKETKMSKLAKRSKDHNKKEGYDEQNREHTKSLIKEFKKG